MLTTLKSMSFSEFEQAMIDLKVNDHIHVLDGFSLLMSLDDGLHLKESETPVSEFTKSSTRFGVINKLSMINTTHEVKMMMLADNSMLIYRQPATGLAYSISNRQGSIADEHIQDVLNGEFHPDWFRAGVNKEGYTPTRDIANSVSEIVIPTNARMLVSVVVEVAYNAMGDLVDGYIFRPIAWAVNGGHPQWNG